MTSRPLPFLVRVLAVLLALLQSASPAMAAVADGVLTARSGGVPVEVHVEGRQQPGCRPVHAADCALCQFLTTAAEPITVSLPFVPCTARPSAPQATGNARATVSGELPSARAPPGG